MPNASQAKPAPPREDRAGKKQRTRARIVAQASRLLREQGLEKPAIDDVMAAADLTRGGFYAHFDNRDALVAEALGKAFDEARKHFFFIGEWADSPKGNLVGKKWVEYAARQYLSEGHLHEQVTRCPLPSLGSEMARTRPEIRHVFTENVREMLDATIRKSGAKTKREKERALRMFCAWVGAVMLARGFDDESLAKDLLQSCKAETLRDFARAKSKKA